ncbi:MAG: type II toxin-antitoxin system RnlA family toxin [Deltaproteobacteria bacterium]|nr:type II toxin-antitoxin system RnlA family toxin [Deltaproteobacteria bacterium]
MESFNDLNLDQTTVDDAINKYCQENYAKPDITKEGKNYATHDHYKYQILADSKTILLNVYFTSTGTTTLQHDVGKNQQESLKIAEFVKKECALDGRKNISLSFKGVSKPVVDGLLIFVAGETCGAKSNVEKDDEKETRIKITGRSKDEITLTYYANRSLRLQGRPLMIFKEICCHLSKDLSLDQIIQAQSKLANVDIKTQDIQYELEARLPRAYVFLDDTLKKILSPSLVVSKIICDMDDYSLYVFPALSGLEGYLKKIFLENGIPIDKNGFGDYMIESSEKFYKKLIQHGNTQQAIDQCYNYIRDHRNILFHVDSSVVATRIIDNREEACGIIDEVLLLIDNSYATITA